MANYRMKPYKGFDHDARMKANPLLDKLAKEGRIPPLETCSTCGQTEGKLSYHCDDYSPGTLADNTRVMCYSCHTVHHMYYNNPNNQGAKLYIAEIRKGKVLRANHSWDFQQLIKDLDWLIAHREPIKGKVENL